jgi:uncharacterized protein YecE (DUF72 family)
MSEIRVGISGWTYPRWRGTFYPKKLKTKNEMEFATRHVGSIEINGTFYRLQNAATFRDWYERSPENFVFSVKGNRYITHAKRLKDPEEGLANFFATGVLELQEKLGPILWQFPPKMKFDEERFREFFKALPRTPKQAAALAKKHKMKFKKDEPVRVRTKAKLRYAVEIRDDSFKDPKFIELLREFNIAYVVADTADRWVYAEDQTADFSYVRLHGFKELYAGGYPDQAIREWARKVHAWNQGKIPKGTTLIAPELQSDSVGGTRSAKTNSRSAHRRTSKSAIAGKHRDVFVYFDNDAKVNAPFDAANLMLHLKRQRDLVLPEESPVELLASRDAVSEKKLLALQDRALNR